MDRINFIMHQGKQILLIDFSNCKAEEVLTIIEQAKTVIKQQPLNSLLTLTDSTDALFNDQVTAKLKEYAAHNRPYVHAGAVVGITGLRKIIFDAVLFFSQRKLATFDNLEAAKNWLAKQ